MLFRSARNASASSAEGEAAPVGLRAKGIDDEKAPALTYVGPSEDGTAAVQQHGREPARPGPAQGGGGMPWDKAAGAGR